MIRPPLLQWPMAASLALALSAGGCIGISLPLGELTDEGPAITGSISTAWQLPAPLPASLAPSDAAAIAEAARQAVAGGVEAAGGWTNADSGSSGSLVLLGEAEVDGEICRTYASTVTSIRGVHIYTCRACRAADGRVSIRSIQASGAEMAATAGI